ncbi:hypothetical protein [Pseudomonas sp. PSE14]|uniref:hypothetical protein n=1 Tax=Pseudomonas sp. PSE14 TaxID=3016341 RepID=UPI0023D8A97F|nr:hypothetical protein [Pseudomonas sp. PSE14]WEJ70316.1 hypothetical protein O6P39_16730 [Pseudomonas sp. PSE14]
MSWNLANRPADERQAMEDEKARLFDFWQQNLDRAKAEAGKLFGERSKRKGKWSEWVQDELSALTPPEFQAMVKREVERLVGVEK